jgi:hypothetical protein
MVVYGCWNNFGWYPMVLSMIMEISSPNAPEKTEKRGEMFEILLEV